VRAKIELNVISLVMVMLLSCLESVMVVFVPEASASPASAGPADRQTPARFYPTLPVVSPLGRASDASFG